MIGDAAYGSRDNKGGTGIGDRAKEPHHGKRGAVRAGVAGSLSHASLK